MLLLFPLISIYAVYNGLYRTLIVKDKNRVCLQLTCEHNKKFAALVQTTDPYPQSKCAVKNPRPQYSIFPKGTTNHNASCCQLE